MMERVIKTSNILEAEKTGLSSSEKGAGRQSLLPL